jgi:ActR/RegA family two-component response regulator
MPKHILIVDDDTLMRRSLAFNLEKAGYQTRCPGINPAGGTRPGIAGYRTTWHGWIGCLTSF